MIRRRFGRWSEAPGGGLARVIGFGVIAGMRSMAAPAFLSYRLTRQQGLYGRSPLRLAASAPGVSAVLIAMAAGEALADKSGKLPARTQPVSLAGRAASGGAMGAVLSAATGPIRPAWILAGAAAAVTSAHGVYYLRRWTTARTRIPDPLVGVAEDALVFAGGRGLIGLI